MLDLAKIAIDIDSAHEAVLTGLADNVSRAAEALFQAKAACKLNRIGFYSWIKAKCRIPVETAKRYMQMARAAQINTSARVTFTHSTCEQPSIQPRVASTTDLIRSMCDVVDGLAQEVARVDGKVITLEGRFEDDIRHREAEEIRHREAVNAVMKSLPGPAVPVPGKSPCDLAEQRVRFWCKQEGSSDFSGAYNRLYEEFRRRCGVDARARHRNDRRKYDAILDVVRELSPELQDKFYAIACELFPLEPRAMGA